MLKLLFFSICFLCFGYSFSQVAQFHFDEESGTTTTTESISGTTFTIANKFNRPERIAGIVGDALRLDATSTWAYHNTYVIPNISKQLTVEVWYTTEAFVPEPAGLLSQESAGAGISVEVDRFGRVSMALHAGSTRITLKSTRMLEPYKWYHIAATVDLSAGLARVIVNGEQWAQSTFSSTFDAITLSNSPLYIGRHSFEKTEGGFIVSALNGAIDELSIFNTVLSDDQLNTRYQNHASAVPDLSIAPEVRHANDNLRPKYHAMPSTSWTNEPYGLIFYNGKYHLFFQKNPNGPFLYFMHWGHLSSPDLVNWTEEKIALAPGASSFDSFGVWSGTTIAGTDDKPVIIYTGVDGVKAGMGVAFPEDDDLERWTKYAGNPVVAAPPAGYAHMDFRDPYVWKAGSTYYMIVGSGLQSNGGGILFTYKSTDLKTWSNIAPLYRRSDTDVTGKFWEMPFFIPIGNDKWILQVLPTPDGPKRARSLYWIGKFENEKFVPDFQVPKDLELISENLLAPAIGRDDQGRTTYMGILPDDRDVNAQVQAGWRHTFSLPRITRLLKDSTLGFYPHPNICRLRGEHKQVVNRKVARNTSFNLPEISGNQKELKFTIKADSASRFLIQLFKHADTQEFVSLIFDLKRNKIGLDRRFSTLSPALKDNRESTYIFDHRDSIRVQIYLDRSTIEVFVDNVVTFSCRAYPSRVESNKVDLVVSDGAVEIIQLDAWDMNSMNATASIEVCEPSADELPEALKKPRVITSPVTSILIEEVREAAFSLYPNPAESQLNIVYSGSRLSAGSIAEVYSSTGKLLESFPLKTNFESLDVKHLEAGIYFVRIRYKKDIQNFKVIIIR
jgi:beta-fructofuranosidase